MTEQWDGRPQNPERDGWHWLLVAEGEPLVAALWYKQMWNLGHIGMPSWVFSGAVYLGPCHTPAEVSALVEAARREEREACARVANEHNDDAAERKRDDQSATGRYWDYNSYVAGMYDGECEAAAAIAAAIRARGDA